MTLSSGATISVALTKCLSTRSTDPTLAAILVSSIVKYVPAPKIAEAVAAPTITAAAATQSVERRANLEYVPFVSREEVVVAYISVRLGIKAIVQ